MEPSRIACTAPEAVASVARGERVIFDDGHLVGIVREHQDPGLLVEITQAVKDVFSALSDLGADHLAVVPKIETRLGFEHLPSILLAAMQRAGAGVMIARGDLAVECGYERLAEGQEEANARNA